MSTIVIPKEGTLYKVYFTNTYTNVEACSLLFPIKNGNQIYIDYNEIILYLYKEKHYHHVLYKNIKGFLVEATKFIEIS